MRSTIHKRLFEVRLLHDYYLISENRSFFEQPSAVQQVILEDRVRDRLLDLRRDVGIKPTAATRVLMDRQKLRYFQTPLGFVVTIEVTQEMKEGEIRYRPRLNIPADMIFHFQMELKNPYFRNFTEERLRRRFETHYYFTNQVEGQNDRILSELVPSFNADLTYEMGDLTLLAGQLHQARQRTRSSSIEYWQLRNGVGFAHEGDRQLLSSRSIYHFPPQNTVGSAAVTIKNHAGQLVKEFQTTIGELQAAQIDLDLRRDENGNDLTSGIYHINILGDNGFVDEREVHLNDNLYNSSPFGVIGISNNADNPANKLLDQDGLLIKPPGETNHPVFEIRMRSRATYWRYILSEGINSAPDHLTFDPANQDKLLVTKKPRSLSMMPATFPAVQPGGTERRYPNPQAHPLKIHEDGRVFSDLNINTIQKLAS